MRYLFIVVLLLIQIILFGAHYVLYRGAVDLFAIKNTNILLWLKIIFGLLSVSFLIASLVGSKIYSSFTHIFYTGAAWWLGALFYILIAFALFLSFKFGFGDLLSIQIIRTVGISFLFVGICLGMYGIYNAGNIHITEISPMIKNIPEVWKGKTAVWISDIHIGQVYSTSFSKEIAEKVQSLNPDIVFLGGDVFDGTAGDLKEAIVPLSKIRSVYGTYFISGNHEEFSADNSFIDMVKESGITVLKNESLIIDGMNIVGVDYRDSENRDTFTTTLKRLINPELPTILLKHAPTNLDIASDAHVAFQISGHTHVAQMFPFMYVTKLVYGIYEYGLHPYTDMSVYTSSGVGTWGPPLRIGTKSEIVKIIFK